jgi:hypothetical protein
MGLQVDPNERMDSLGITSQVGSAKNAQLYSGRGGDMVLTDLGSESKMLEGLNQYLGQQDSNKVPYELEKNSNMPQKYGKAQPKLSVQNPMPFGQQETRL